MKSVTRESTTVDMFERDLARIRRREQMVTIIHWGLTVAVGIAMLLLVWGAAS